MAKQHLLLNSHNVKPEACWWYEENHGMTIVVRQGGMTEEYRIPWQSIRAALKRKDRP